MKDLAKIFTEADIYFELYKHRAIYTNEDAVIISQEQGFSGTETKSLFLKRKDGKHFIYLTYTTQRTDFKKIQKFMGKKFSIVANEEMESLTGQVTGAVAPFGYDQEDVPVIIDEKLLSEERLIFAPGRPDRTMVVRVKDLFDVLSLLEVEYFILPQADLED